MKKHARILSFLLGLMMIFQTLPVSALSDGEVRTGEPVMQVAAMPVLAAANGTVYELGMGGNASSWVNNAELLVETVESTPNLVDITKENESVTIPEYANFQIKIPFTVPSQDNTDFPGLKAGDTIVYTIPSWVRKLDTESGNLTVGARDAGTWKLENGKIVITLYEDFVKDEPYGLNGTVAFSGSMNVTKSSSEDAITEIIFLDKTINTVVREREDALKNIDIQKKQTGFTYGGTGANSGEISKVSYELTVFAGDLTGNAQRNTGDLENIVINDAFITKEKYAFVNEAGFFENEDLKQYITYSNIQATIYDQNGVVVTDRVVKVVDSDQNDAAAQFQIVLNDDNETNAVLHPDEKVVITYDAVIDKEMYQHNPRGPMEAYTDTSDHYANAYGSGGSAKNAQPQSGTNNAGQNRSWVARTAENTATVSTRSLDQPKTAIVKDNEGKTVKPVEFGKTWLWKNGTPLTNYKSDYEISLNENPIMNIIGWTFEDDVSSYGQEIVSDVRIVRNDGTTYTISLSDLLRSGGITSGNAAGSSTSKIKYTFTENGQYRIYFTARQMDTSSGTDTLSKNGATLTEPSGNEDGDTYGVYETHTVRGATVTKRFDTMDLINGTLRWQTTIDEGIGIKNGSVYKDFIGWIRKPGNNQANKESTLADNDVKSDHTIDLSKMNLVITSGEGSSMVTLPTSAYEVSILSKEDIQNSGTNTNGDNGVSGWNVAYGFKIVFKDTYPGPVLIHYNTVGDFANVVGEEEFTNKMTYQADPNSNSLFNDTAFTSYSQKGTLNKVAESINGDSNNPIIKWHLTVNEAQYEAASLKLEDTIPEGLQFDLLRDLQVRWVENAKGVSGSTLEDWRGAYTGDRNAPNDFWPTKTAINPDNDYFTATYDSSTRKLTIILKDVSHKKVEFNIYTQPKISELSNGETYTYQNSAFLYTNSTTQTNQLLQSASAEASVRYDFVGKGVTYNESTAPNAEYEIEVNPSGIDIYADGDRYEVEDSAPEGSTLLFLIPATLEVRDQYGNKLTLNETPGTQLSANEVRLTAIGDHSFTLDVPDNKKLTIKYKAFVPGVLGETANLSNSVTLLVNGQRIVSHDLTESQEIQKSTVDLNAANRIRVRKGSTGENAVMLDGAEFDIFDVTNVENYEIIQGTIIGKITTGVKKPDGSYEVGFGLASTYAPTHITLDNFRIYKIVEVQAPKGYQTPKGEDAVVGTFVFVTETPPEGTTQEQYLQLIQAYRAAGIQVINQNYTDFTFYKSNEPLGTLTVTKKMQFNGVEDTTAEGTFYVALFDGDQLFGEVKQIDVANGLGTAQFADLEWGKTYTLKETDANGVPVGDGFAYEVIYKDDQQDFTATKENLDLTAEIINNRITGNLMLKKTIFIGNDKYDTQEPGDESRTFKATIRTTDAEGNILYVKDENGTLTSTKDEAGSFEFGVTNTVTISNLPTGTYVVEEILGENNEEVAIGRLNFVAAVSTTKTEVQVEAKMTAEAELVNHYTRGSFCIMVTKAWDDENDYDGLRPESITVQLYRGTRNGDAVTMDENPQTITYKLVNGEKITGTDITLSQTNNWTFEATGFPKYDDNGVPYVYEWREVGATGGDIKEYEVSYDRIQESPNETDITYLYRITNKHTPAKVSATVTKTWEDGDNQDGIRPEAVYVTLLADDEAIENYRLSEANNWTITRSDLPKNKTVKTTDAQGIETLTQQEIVYTWEEMDVPAGYEMAITSEKDEDGKVAATITNTHTPETTKVTVNKVWDDNNDQDGVRKDVSATVQLRQTVNGNTTDVGEAVQIQVGENWSHTWENLPVNYNGKQIIYSVVESLPEDSPYTAIYAPANLPAMVEDSGTIVLTNTNSLKPGITQVTVKKVWDDANDQDGKRSSVVATAQLQKTVNGETSSTGDAVTIDPTTDWSHTWTNLPVFEDGQRITYSVLENMSEANGYTTSTAESVIAAPGDSGTIILKNTYQPETVSTKLQKVWADEENHDGLRPETLTVTLVSTAEGENPVETDYVLGPASGWKREVTGLPRYANGKEISYTWTEKTENIPAGYTMSSAKDGDTTIITNTHTNATTSAKVIKTWLDDDNKLGLRPASVEMTLLADNLPTDITITLPVNGQWTYTAENLAKYNPKGDLISYSWMEDTADLQGYVLTNIETVKAADGTATTTITNKYTPEYVTMTVVKSWDDNGDQDEIRPKELTVTLYKGESTDSRQKVKDYTLKAKDNWILTTEQLPKYEDGKEIRYFFEETQVPAGYTLESTAKSGSTFVFVNRHEPTWTERTVMKIWDDGNNLAGIRPEKLTVRLSNGTEIILSEENHWTATVTNLPRYEDGEEIEYTWTEETPEGYVLASTVTEGNITILTNSTQAGSLRIEKFFAGLPEDTDVSGLTFLVTGPEDFEPIEIKYGDFNQKTFHILTDLPEGEYTVTETNAAGLVAQYNLSAESVTTGKANVTGTTAAAIQLINVYTKRILPSAGEFTATKTWINPEAGDSLTASLTLVGYTREDNGDLTETGRYTKSLTGNGSVKWENIPRFTEDGRPIIYTLHEDGVGEDGKVNGFVSTIIGDEVSGFTVINRKPEVKVETVEKEVVKEVVKEVEKRVEVPVDRTVYVTVTPEPTETPEPTPTMTPQIVYVTPTPTPTPEPTPEPTPVPEIPTTSVSVRKIWDDNNNEAGMRPASVAMTLSNGAIVILDEANGWSATVENLPIMTVDGERITYSWREQEVLGYIPSVSVRGGETVFTNTYRSHGSAQEDRPQPKQPVSSRKLYVLDDYGTPLGVEVPINHVGDCFD